MVNSERSALVEAESLLALLELVVEGVAEQHGQLNHPAGSNQSSAVPRTIPAKGIPVRGIPWKGLQLTIGQIRERLNTVLSSIDTRNSTDTIEHTAHFVGDTPSLAPPHARIDYDHPAQKDHSEQRNAARSEPTVEHTEGITPPAPPRVAPPLETSSIRGGIIRENISVAEITHGIEKPSMEKSGAEKSESNLISAALIEAARAEASRAEESRAESLRVERGVERKRVPDPARGTLASRIQMAPIPTDPAARPRPGKTRELNVDLNVSKKESAPPAQTE